MVAEVGENKRSSTPCISRVHNGDVFLCFHSLFQVMSMLYPKVTGMFHFAGDKHSTPNCPVALRPDLNPSSGIQSYDGSDPMCLTPAHYNIPFFLDRLGPKFSEWNVNAHEARPGHHIQVFLYI